MPPGESKLVDFKQLEVWKKARALRREVYRLTQTFPKQEAYGLSLQMRRAAVSVTADLAEGYGRYSYQENVQFCRQRRGSAYELRDHFTTVSDEGYAEKERCVELDRMAMDVIRLVNGYIRSTQRLKREAAGTR